MWQSVISVWITIKFTLALPALKAWAALCYAIGFVLDPAERSPPRDPHARLRELAIPHVYGSTVGPWREKA